MGSRLFCQAPSEPLLLPRYRCQLETAGGTILCRATYLALSDLKVGKRFLIQMAMERAGELRCDLQIKSCYRSFATVVVETIAPSSAKTNCGFSLQ